MVIVAVALLLLLAGAGLTYAAWVYVSPLVLAIGFAAYPLVGLVVWLFYVDTAQTKATRIADLEKKKGMAEAALAGANADLTRMRAAVEAAQAEIATLQSQLADSERQSGAERAQAGARISDLEGQLAVLYIESARLRSTVATHEKAAADYEERECQRLAWRTLPQGHDLETERFAATVANALR